MTRTGSHTGAGTSTPDSIRESTTQPTTTGGMLARRRRRSSSFQPREVSFLCVVCLLCAAVLTMEQIRHSLRFRKSKMMGEFEREGGDTDPDPSTSFIVSDVQRHLSTVHQKVQQQQPQQQHQQQQQQQQLQKQVPLPLTLTTTLTLPTEPLPPLSRLPTSIDDALHMIRKLRLERHERATFLQIGANDGITNDPLYKAWVMTPNRWKSIQDQRAAQLDRPPIDYRIDWMGLQVEPQPQLFDQMRNTIGSPTDWYYYNGVVVANTVSTASTLPLVTTPTEAAAAAATLPPPQCVNGTIFFCETKTPGQGDWSTQGQINSIRADKCQKKRNKDRMHLVPRPCVASLVDLVQAVQTSAATQQRPLSSSFLDSLDMLQIDTEGHDLPILQMLFADATSTTIRPLCLHYEHWGAGQQAIDLVRRFGYTVSEKSGSDRLACRIHSSARGGVDTTHSAVTPLL